MKGWPLDTSLPNCGWNLPEIIVHSAPEFTNGLENLTEKYFERDLLNLTCGALGENDIFF